MSNRSKLIWLAVASFALIVIFFAWGINANNAEYFLMKRTPKILGIVFAGVTIAVSSIIFQTITNNRILTPSILGLDALFTFTQAALIFLFGSTSAFVVNKNINFAVATIVMVIGAALLFQFLLKKHSSNIMLLLLVGVVFGTLLRSLTTFIQMVIDPNEFQALQDKMFASFSNIQTELLMTSFIIFLLTIPYLHRKMKYLDVMLLGRDTAITLGVPYDKLAKQMLILIALLVSISTALVGPITFLGIIVVNLTYEIFRTYSHKIMFIASSLIAIIALLGGQILMERVFAFGTPVSVIINLVGGIYFIILLLKVGDR